jgi:hypothetical protein
MDGTYHYSQGSDDTTDIDSNGEKVPHSEAEDEDESEDEVEGEAQDEDGDLGGALYSTQLH